ncbi:hypothetical protein [Bacillus massiliglaciei]|uniref:hypothetical protein n=1 Tax=Bacillus massiliglaciei TaxID=1816693 RepID=UPI000DA615A7|nr:hypothetical protein [Bacillus massiliglaciei]
MVEKRLGIEGTPASKMVQLMRKYGYSKDLTIEVATVISPLPDMTLKIQHEDLTLDRDDFYVSGTVLKDNPSVGEKVILISDEDVVFYVMDTAH